MEQAIKALAIQLDELTAAVGKMTLAVEGIQTRDQDRRIAEIERLLRDQSIKLDSLSTDGITVTTSATIPLEGKESKKESKTEVKAEVSDPGAVAGNITEFFKFMWMNKFDALLEKKVVTDEHAAQRALCIKENADRPPRQASTRLRSLATSVYRSMKDGPEKDLLKALRTTYSSEYAKASATPIPAEATD